MRTQCLACHSEAFRFKQVGQYWLYKCESCLLEFCHPMPHWSDLKLFYRDYRDPLSAPDVQRINALRKLALLLKWKIQRRDEILDYGCGEDIFAAVMREQGYVNTAGVDDMNGRGQSLDKNVNYDWITTWGVLEHLQNPGDTLDLIRFALKPQGRVALTTLSIETPIPYRHKPPEHLLYFTRESIDHLARGAGFMIAGYYPYVAIQRSDVYLNTLLRTMPATYQGKVKNELPTYVEVPTNEVFVVLEKCPQH